MTPARVVNLAALAKVRGPHAMREDNLATARCLMCSKFGTQPAASEVDKLTGFT